MHRLGVEEEQVADRTWGRAAPKEFSKLQTVQVCSFPWFITVIT